MKQIIELENLSCQNCVRHVTQAFLQLKGVSEVTIDLNSALATVTTSQAHSLETYQLSLDKTIYKVVKVD